jgi:hypothetical protein
MSNSTQIKEIKITLYTNIPTATDYEKSILTFSSISSPELKELTTTIRPDQKPFFTYNIKYTESVLGSLTYVQIVKTFFKKDSFLKRFAYLSQYSYDKDEYKKNEQKKEVIDNNIMLMLKYLLPTRYPAVNNHYNSYDLLVGKRSLKALFFNPFTTRKPTVLKISGKLYTLKKVIWLNDILNHPEYKNFLNDDDKKRPEKNSKGSNNSNILFKEYDPKFDFGKINECYVKTCGSDIMKQIYVGLDNDDNNYDAGSTPFEIYLDVELIEDELKPEEEKNIKCANYSDYLGNELSKLIKRKNPTIVIKKGQIEKKPLFSKTKLTSRKKTEIEAEEKISDELKNKREKENRYYNDLDNDVLDNYETIFNPVFDKLSRGKFKNKIRDFDINKKNFYFFLQSNESILNNLFNLIISGENNGIKNLLNDNYFNESSKNDTVFSKIDKEIFSLNKFRATVTSKTREENKETIFQYELLKEFIRELKVKFTQVKGGGGNIITYKKSKRKNTINKKRNSTRKRS